MFNRYLVATAMHVVSTDAPGRPETVTAMKTCTWVDPGRSGVTLASFPESLLQIASGADQRSRANPLSFSFRQAAPACVRMLDDLDPFPPSRSPPRTRVTSSRGKAKGALKSRPSGQAPESRLRGVSSLWLVPRGTNLTKYRKFWEDLGR